MDEIGFVLKSFLVSAFIVFLMQMKMNQGQSVESYVVGYLQDAWATQWMKDMSRGAVRGTASIYKQTVGAALGKPILFVNKATDIKSEMKAVEESAARRERDLLDIENR